MKLARKHLLTSLFLIVGLSLFLIPPNSPPLRVLAQVSYFILLPVLKVQKEIEEEVEKSVLLYENFRNNLKLITKLRKLEQENEILKRELQSYKTLVNKIEKDLNLQFKPEVKYAISKIVFYDPSGSDKFFVILGGKDKGIKKGNIVISQGMVLGVVDEVYPSTSKVITLFNENCSLPAKVDSVDKVYVYKGGFPEGRLLYVDIEDNLPKDGVVYYKDLSLKVPEVPIGKTTKVSLQNSPFFKEVKVKPFLSPREAEFVVVFVEE